MPNKDKLGKPPGAKGKITQYNHNGKKWATDGRNHWYVNAFGTWTRTISRVAPTYNRFKSSKSGRGGIRAASFAVRLGSGATYRPAKKRKTASISSGTILLTQPSRAKRSYAAKMKLATASEGIITTDSATAYAAAFNAPVIPGGYNWCHLIGHGAGGSDNANNIVAASTHVNSEQLAIERIVYQYRDKLVSARVDASRYANSMYLAEELTYRVYVKGQGVYTRQMDAFRTSKPTFTELQRVERDLTAAIVKHL